MRADDVVAELYRRGSEPWVCMCILLVNFPGSHSENIYSDDEAALEKYNRALLRDGQRSGFITIRVLPHGTKVEVVPPDDYPEPDRQRALGLLETIGARFRAIVQAIDNDKSGFDS